MDMYDSPAMRRHRPEDFYDDQILQELDRSGFIEKIWEQGRSPGVSASGSSSRSPEAVR